MMATIPQCLLIDCYLTNQIPAARHAAFIVQQMKIYGLFIDNASGMQCSANWNKPTVLCQRLENSTPPNHLSLFGRVSTVMTYFLSFLWYVSSIVSPPVLLVRRFEHATDRYLWYPSLRNRIKKQIVKLPVSLGGLNYPDIEARFWQ